MSDSGPKKRGITVGDFLEAGREKLGLELEAGGDWLDRPIHEATMNRPGLALTGFLQYFAHRRAQILGHAENAYLASLPAAERTARLTVFFEHGIPCVIVTRNRKIVSEIRELAERFRTPVLRSPMITMHFINAATLLMENLRAPRMLMQGTMVDIQGIGILIEGAAGVGKSEAALTLLKRGCSLIADDVTALRLDSSGTVIGAPIGVTRYHMEIRGLGIIHVPSLFGVGSVRGEKQLDLIITLSTMEQYSSEDQFSEKRRTRDVLGVAIPTVTIPVAPGRDVANLVETAALDQKLKRLGHDAAKELDDKLKVVLTGGERTT